MNQKEQLRVTRLLTAFVKTYKKLTGIKLSYEDAVKIMEKSIKNNLIDSLADIQYRVANKEKNDYWIGFAFDDSMSASNLEVAHKASDEMINMLQNLDKSKVNEEGVKINEKTKQKLNEHDLTVRMRITYSFEEI